MVEGLGRERERKGRRVREMETNSGRRRMKKTKENEVQDMRKGIKEK